MIFLGILISFLIFSFIVLIHEYGHFRSARFFGVKVDEFGLGIPPRAKKVWKDAQGTLYSLNWIPLWGFVKIAWESPRTFLLYDEKWKLLDNKHLEKFLKEDTEIFEKSGKKIHKKERGNIQDILLENNKHHNLFQKPAWQQSIIILAGVYMNFLLAFIIFSTLFFFWVKPVGINTALPISSELKLIPTQEEALEIGLLEEKKGTRLFPLENSLAAKAGIQEGDVLLRINNQNFESIEEVQERVRENREKEIVLYIERVKLCPKNTKTNSACPVLEYLELHITPGKDGKIGTYLAPNISVNQNFSYKYGIWESLKYGFLETKWQIHLTFVALKVLAQKLLFPEIPAERDEAVESLSGPIGIVDFITESMSAGVMFLIILTAIISINLWVFNLLPIPALDGGRFLFIILNTISFSLFGRKGVSSKIENSIHIFFFIILIALSFIIAYNDIIKILNK